MSFPTLISSNTCVPSKQPHSLVFLFPSLDSLHLNTNSTCGRCDTAITHTDTVKRALFIEFITLNQKRHSAFCMIIPKIMRRWNMKRKIKFIGQRRRPFFLLLSFMERKKIPIFCGGKTKKELPLHEEKKATFTIRPSFVPC